MDPIIMGVLIGVGVLILIVGFWLLTGIKVILEYERLVVFRLGR